MNEWLRVVLSIPRCFNRNRPFFFIIKVFTQLYTTILIHNGLVTWYNTICILIPWEPMMGFRLFSTFFTNNWRGNRLYHCLVVTNLPHIIHFMCILKLLQEKLFLCEIFIPVISFFSHYVIKMWSVKEINILNIQTLKFIY